MKHIILGAGNLGIDLELELNRKGHETQMFSRSTGWDHTKDALPAALRTADAVWCAIGFGSVRECKADFLGALESHVHLPMRLMERLPEETRLFLFSSDYVADFPPKSLYQCSKGAMEEAAIVINRPRTGVIRVASLYGEHLPEKTFPGKLRRAYPEPCAVDLPDNSVTPTPTGWLAEMLVKYQDAFETHTGSMIQSLAPEGPMHLMEFGALVLGEGYEFFNRGYDPERPRNSNIGNTLLRTERCRELWLRTAWAKDRNFGKI